MRHRDHLPIAHYLYPFGGIMIRRLVAAAVPLVALLATTGPGLTRPAGAVTAPVAAPSGAGTTGPPLSVRARISVPITSDGAFPSVAAEAPDGAVFVSDPAHDQVWVVDGDGPAASALHVAGVINALAADASSLYVATFSTVYRYSRATGAKVSQWALPATKPQSSSNALLVSLSAVNGTLWAFVDDGDNVNVYSINPDSRQGPHLVVRSLGAAVSPDGALYYERADARLIRVADGTVRVGPRLDDRPNGLGGGVQYIDSVAGGEVWVVDPAGQGLDATYSAFNSSTLVAGATFQGSVGDMMANTRIGPLMVSGAESQAVQRISATGRLTARLRLAGAEALVGPAPAVVAWNQSGNALVLDRLS
jgi:hypothetical protein